MTVEEKRNAIREYCDKRWSERHNCALDSDIPECPLYKDKSNACAEDDNENTINRNYDMLVNAGLITTDHSSAVNHPNHYNREGSMECIDEMVTIFGKEAVASFCLCNVWKYRYRAADKNGIEDLKKSDWYMNKYKELTSNEQATSV